jgi:hypothetical protein
MIFRKQNYFLLLAAIIILLIAFIPFSIAAGSNELGQSVITNYVANANTPITICTAALLVLCIAAIVLHANRQLALRISTTASGLALVVIVLQVLFIINNPGSKPYFGIALPILTLLLTAMASRGIGKDINALKNESRFRD